MGLMRDLLMCTRISSGFETIDFVIDYDFKTIEDENYLGYVPPVYDFNGYDVFCDYLISRIKDIYDGKYIIQLYEVGKPMLTIFYDGDKPNEKNVMQIIEDAKEYTNKCCEEYLITRELVKKICIVK